MVLVTQQSGLADEDFAIGVGNFDSVFFSGKISPIFTKKLGKLGNFFKSVILTNFANF
jgi:hypothetical protein